MSNLGWYRLGELAEKIEEKANKGLSWKVDMQKWRKLYNKLNKEQKQ